MALPQLLTKLRCAHSRPLDSVDASRGISRRSFGTCQYCPGASRGPHSPEKCAPSGTQRNQAPLSEKKNCGEAIGGIRNVLKRRGSLPMDVAADPLWRASAKHNLRYAPLMRLAWASVSGCQVATLCSSLVSKSSHTIWVLIEQAKLETKQIPKTSQALSFIASPCQPG